MSGADDKRPIPLRPRRKCPICGQASTRESYPFCSKRCADVDLNRWLSGSYAIPGEPAESTREEDEE